MNKTSRNYIGIAAIFLSFLVAAGTLAAYARGLNTDQSDQRDQAREERIRVELDKLAHVRHRQVCDAQEVDGVKCHARVVSDSKGGPRVNAVPSGYGPKQFLGAYNLSGLASSNPAPLIAIVDAYNHPRIASDLDTYSATFGIPKLPSCSGPIKNSQTPCFQKMNQNGGTSSFPKSNSGWALEIALDVEVAHAACQNCRILLVEANSASYSNLLKAIDTAVANNAMVVSGSWGSGEFSSENSFDSHFNKPGVAFTFSAGDSGFGTSYPAASPYVTAVGGTTLLLNPDNSYLSESTWSGTGSGCSVYEAKPAWQHDALCGNRTIGDVAADADPATGAAVYDSVSYFGRSGWFQAGGTSLSAPLIAAVYALQGVPSGLQANSAPYSQGNSLNLHDIVSGSNGSCGNYLCTAQLGYDGPTGLGTPNGTSAF